MRTGYHRETFHPYRALHSTHDRHWPGKHAHIEEANCGLSGDDPHALYAGMKVSRGSSIMRKDGVAAHNQVPYRPTVHIACM